MKEASIKRAVEEAKRFIERAEAWEAAAQESVAQYKKQEGHVIHDATDYRYKMDCQNLPREQGALKRASMDLTRALAELRKSR